RTSPVNTSPIVLVRSRLEDLHALSVKNHDFTAWVICYIIDVPIVISTVIIRRKDFWGRQVLRLGVHMKGYRYGIATAIGTYSCYKISSGLRRSSCRVCHIGNIKTS